jgi:hypothetical protein
MSIHRNAAEFRQDANGRPRSWPDRPDAFASTPETTAQATADPVGDIISSPDRRT